jgi:hypothetical protein
VKAPAATRHGTRSCYVLGCRRPECFEANRVYMRDYMRRRRAGVVVAERKGDDGR